MRQGRDDGIDSLDPMPSPLSRTLVVMPAFNEEASVGAVVREVREKAPEVHILVVDDGSTDGTAEVARSAQALVAVLPFNLGVGGAMRVGFRYAIEHGYENVVQIDADGQHDPAGLAPLVAALDDADLVLGARFAGAGEYTAKGPRRWAMEVLARAISRVAGTRLTDTTSGFRASGPRAVRLFADHYPAEYLGDTVESLVIACRRGLTVRQIPTAMRKRAAGTPSQNAARSTVYLGRAVLALMFALIRPAASYGAGATS